MASLVLQRHEGPGWRGPHATSARAPDCELSLQNCGKMQRGAFRIICSVEVGGLLEREIHDESNKRVGRATKERRARCCGLRAFRRITREILKLKGKEKKV
jgi:hypothetical protein